MQIVQRVSTTNIILLLEISSTKIVSKMKYIFFLILFTYIFSLGSPYRTLGASTPLLRFNSTQCSYQANSEICDPPLSNRFDLEVGQKSWSRWEHGTIGKVLSQRTHMQSITFLPSTAKCMAKVKVFDIDRRTDRRTDGRVRFNVPAV